jgi:hypothetical protein
MSVGEFSRSLELNAFSRRLSLTGAGIPEGIAMIKIDGLPFKTRVPLTAWITAGLLTLLSIVASAVHVTPASDRAVSASALAEINAHQASMNW